MQAIAIDTGATKISVAVIDDAANIHYKKRFANPRIGPLILESYHAIISEILAEFSIDAIGIGTGGQIDPQNGSVIASSNIYKQYDKLEIKKDLEGFFNIPTSVDNDGRVALYGEKWVGAVKEYKNVAAIILGTGVGGGLLINGEIYYGNGYRAGEIGHSILHPGGVLCLCGQEGCAEQYISASALWRELNKKKGYKTAQDGYDFFEILKKGDEDAKSVLDLFVENLAVCCVNITNILAPEAILLGGGLSEVSECWWEQFQQSYYAKINPNIIKTDLLLALKGNDAALFGAARIAFKALDKA